MYTLSQMVHYALQSVTSSWLETCESFIEQSAFQNKSVKIPLSLKIMDRKLQTCEKYLKTFWPKKLKEANIRKH